MRLENAEVILTFLEKHLFTVELSLKDLQAKVYGPAMQCSTDDTVCGAARIGETVIGSGSSEKEVEDGTVDDGSGIPTSECK